jgi:ankyrin repeat protein
MSSSDLPDRLSPDDAKHLVRLCRAGRLYEIEDWIRAGKSLTFPPELKTTLLAVALKTGFHSLIELLLRHERSQERKNALLAQAVQDRRSDLVELAVLYGADANSVSFADVLMTWDRRLASFFLERGADPIADRPFMWAFCEKVKTALGCYLDCKRSRPELAVQLQEQADIALREFSEAGNLKWVSLLLWLGANPRSKGPRLRYLDDDPDSFTTAFEEACMHGHLEVLKRLGPDPARDDLSALLHSAAFFANTEVLSYLLGLGARPNDKPDGSSDALDCCIRHLGWEDLDRVLYGRSSLTPAYKVSKTRESIRVLIEHGARWKPGHRLNDVRRILYKLEPDVTIELVDRLRKHQACDDEDVRSLLQTPRMQEHLRSEEQRLWRLGLTLDGRIRTKELVAKDAPPSLQLLARFDRERLYQEVWSEAAQKVAARYKISGVMLGKVCRQLNVPKPPRGYWAKRAAGKPVPRRPRLRPLATPPR